jgi:hypothetical protein
VDVHLTGTPAGAKTWCRHLGRSGAGANEGGKRKASKQPKMQVQFNNELFELKIPSVGFNFGLVYRDLGRGSRLSGNEIQGFELTFPHVASSSSISSDKRRFMHGYVSYSRTMQVSYNGPHLS